MTTFGFIELLAILTTLGGFGVNANPKAPAPATVMKYAPSDADMMMHVDVQAVVPSNYKAFKALPNHKLVKGNADARQAIQEGIREIDVALASAKGFSGIDLVNDVHSITGWVKLPSAGTPDFLVVLRGNLKADILTRMAQITGSQVQDVGGSKTLSAPDGSATLALKNGELLLGTPGWIKPRLQNNWRAQRPRAGSPGANITALLRDKPFMFVASNPSSQAARRLLQEMPGRDNVAADLLNGHSFAALSVRYNGVTWRWDAKDKDGYNRAVMVSEGMIELFRSSHFATRGLARVVIGALHSYKGREPAIDMILRHKDELMKLVTDITGDGKFRADFKRAARKRSLTVKATGKKLSDVVPLAGMAPLLGASLFFVAGASASKSAMSAPAEVARAEPAPESRTRAAPVADKADAMPAPASGLDVQKVYRSVKRARGL